MLLGLSMGKMDCPPTTAYLMTYAKSKCTANCAFCPQARESGSRSDALSRVTWPAFETRRVIQKLIATVKTGVLKRVCIQCLNYPKMIEDVTALAETINNQAGVSVSVSCQPHNAKNIKRLKGSGVSRIGIPLDAAREDLFFRIKGESAGGPYSWSKQFSLLEEAASVFGEGNVSTHLIVGLGETEEDLVRVVQKCLDLGVIPGLFAFTPIAGTALEKNHQPPLKVYRRVQLARYLMLAKKMTFKDFLFDDMGIIIAFGVEDKELLKAVRAGEAFRTSGCPDCNRPYYNEKPGGPIYNFPRPLTEEEISSIEEQFKPFL